MPQILFLVGDEPYYNDNHIRLPRTFAARAWEATLAPHQDLVLENGHLRVGSTDIDTFDLIWLLGFGARQSFLDRMQLLRRVDQRRFVNCVDAYVYLHGKSAFDEFLPETYSAAVASHLIERLDHRSDWILKPSGASFGRDVSRIRHNAAGHQAIKRMIQGQGFAILQRYVDAAAEGETRCLVAGGEIIGCYQKRATADGQLANLRAGATPHAHQLSPEERALAEAVGERLMTADIGFAAVDLAGAYLIEVNVANPGGLGTLQELSGIDPTPLAVDAIIRHRFEASPHSAPSR